jgi:hypothetical protein
MLQILLHRKNDTLIGVDFTSYNFFGKIKVLLEYLSTWYEAYVIHFAQGSLASLF